MQFNTAHLQAQLVVPSCSLQHPHPKQLSQTGHPRVPQHSQGGWCLLPQHNLQVLSMLEKNPHFLLNIKVLNQANHAGPYLHSFKLF